MLSKESIIDLISIGIILGVSIYVSLVFGVIMYLIYVCCLKRITFIHYVYPIFIFACVAFTTYSSWKHGDSDIIRYYDSYNSYRNLSFLSGITHVISNKDSGFYFLVLCVSHILPKDPRWFSFFMVTLTSLLYLLSYRFYNKGFFYRKSSLFLWTFSFVCIISFHNYTNAYRQFLAFAIFIIALRYYRYHWKAIICFSIAFIFHWSMIMLIVPYYGFGLIHNKNYRNSILIICLLLGLIGFGSILYSLNHNTGIYYGAQVLGVDKTMMLVQFLSITISYILIINSKQFHSYDYQLFTALVSLTSIIYIFILDSTVITRLSFNWTSLFVILLPSMLILKSRIAIPRLFVGCCILLFVTYNLISLSRGIPISYMLFTDYGINSSFYSIVSSPSPF